MTISNIIGLEHFLTLFIMMKKRKFNFLILEVLISFMLLTMALLPFSSYPYKVFQRELSSLESLEIRPYYTSSFYEAFDKFQNSEPSILNDLNIPFGKKGSLTVKRSFDVKVSKPLKNNDFQVATISVTFKTNNSSETFQRKFLIKKQGELHAI